MRQLDQEIINNVDDEGYRKHVFARDDGFPYFCIYHFPEFFTHAFADFHFDLFSDLEKLTQHQLNTLIWIIFRESAKTTLAKMYVVWCICTEKKHYINYDSFDRNNSEEALFDIALWLQTNESIIDDYGHLYFEENKKKDDDRPKASTQKQLGKFVTTNLIKVEAFSTEQTTRGRVFGKFRPELYIVDDFETSKTKNSVARTIQVMEHISEMRGGLGTTGAVIFLGNFITETGSVAWLIDNAKDNDRTQVRKIPVEDKFGVLAWPAKYVKTNSEANTINANLPPEKWVVSLQQKEKDLTSAVYKTEMLNDPSSVEDKIFDRVRVDEDIKKVRACDQNIGGFMLWGKYNPSHRYAIGADTSKGVGRDSNTSALMDFSAFPYKMVGIYANNEITPRAFGHELIKQGNMFGQCLLAPENNNTGQATITAILEDGTYPIDRIYAHTKSTTVNQKVATEYGWPTNGATKPKMVLDFKEAYESGHIEIFDIGLLNEMRVYGQLDMETMTVAEGVTRHFDKLTAACIVYQMKNHASLPKKEKKKVVETYKPRNSSIGV